MLDLRTLILTLRPDLPKALGQELTADSEIYITWLLTSGMLEYKSVGDESSIGEFLSQSAKRSKHISYLQRLIYRGRPDLHKAFPLPAKKREFETWFYTHGIEECRLWPFLSDTEKKQVLATPEPWGSRLKEAIVEQLPPRQKKIALENRQPGVNVIGYAFGQLGIGEDARMAARALLAAQVPCLMLNFPPGNDIPQNDISMVDHVSQCGDFAFNIFCMTAEETGRFYAERGNGQFLDRYNIGYWPWELEKWPKRWEMMLDLVDEVWVSTQHTYDAVAPVTDKPVFIMPMAAEVSELQRFASRKRAREHFGLPVEPLLYCFAFDLKSHQARKNPEGCIEAFQAAFPRKRFSSKRVGLVIKVMKPAGRNKAWDKLTKLAQEDPRIHLIESVLPRAELLALYKCCDCYLSLHRAEGYGRGMAEALQLGLHIICTGYSGNVDFCKPPHADLVNYELVKVKKTEYVHSEGQRWAQPDLKHAAQLLRAFERSEHKRSRRAWREFSPEFIGANYRKRLQEIWQRIKTKNKT